VAPDSSFRKREKVVMIVSQSTVIAFDEVHCFGFGPCV
jgi:hypothetical protein